jgi:hypothetical protein
MNGIKAMLRSKQFNQIPVIPFAQMIHGMASIRCTRGGMSEKTRFGTLERKP